MADGRCVQFPKEELEWVSESSYHAFLSAARLERRMDDEAVLSRLICHECQDGSLVLSLRSVGGSTLYSVGPGKWGRVGKSSERTEDAVRLGGESEADVEVKLRSGRKIRREIAREDISPREDIRMVHKRLDTIVSAIPIYLQHERHLLHAALRALWMAGRRVSEAEVGIDSQAKHDFVCRANEFTEYKRDEVWPQVRMRLTGGVDKRELMLGIPSELNDTGCGLFLHLVPSHGWKFRTSFQVCPEAPSTVINPDEPF